MEHKSAHDLSYEFRSRYLQSRQLYKSGRIEAFLEAITAILWG